MATLDLIVELRQERKYEQALKELENTEMTADLYIQKGLILYELSRFEEAIQAYSESINLDGSNPKAYSNRGNAKGNLFRFNEAIEDYNKAIELNPEYCEAYFNRGYVLYNLGKYKESINDYNKAIELDPKNFMAYNNRGNAKHFLRDYDDAISDFDKSIEIRSTHNTYFNRALAKENINDLSGAIKDYTSALDLKPNDIQVLLKRGYAECQNCELDSAKEDYEQVLKIDKNNIEALVSLGLIYHVLNDDEQAIQLYDKAISLYDKYPDAYINRSISASALKRYEIAESDLRKMLTFDIFKNDYNSTFNYIREIVSPFDDEATKEFLNKLDEIQQLVKK